MNPIFDKYYNEKTRVFWHIAFWLFYLLQNVLIIGSLPKENYTEVFLSRGVNLFPKIIITYFILYFLIPKYFLKKKILIFSSLFILTLLIGGILQHIYFYFVTNPLVYPERDYT